MLVQRIELANAIGKISGEKTASSRGGKGAEGEVVVKGLPRGRVHIEKTILRLFQESSPHQPSPGSSLSPENMSVGQSRPFHATPASFFARVGSAANSSSLRYRARYQQCNVVERAAPYTGPNPWL
jgi:hypothetical protein